MDLYNGKITFSSQEGIGTEFIVILPFVKDGSQDSLLKEETKFN